VGFASGAVAEVDFVEFIAVVDEDAVRTCDRGFCIFKRQFVVFTMCNLLVLDVLHHQRVAAILVLAELCMEERFVSFKRTLVENDFSLNVVL